MANEQDEYLKRISRDFIEGTLDMRYSYRFTWKGLPIIQFPQDVLAMQELIWRIKPELIIETGIGAGGSVLFYDSLQFGDVWAIDKYLTTETRTDIEELAEAVTLYKGCSVEDFEDFTRECDEYFDPVMVVLDSDHTRAHVLAELQLYSSFVTKGSYLIVMDTIIEFVHPDCWKGKEYGVGNNPYTAVQEFLKTNDRFEVDESIPDRVGITCAPGGWLRCVK